MSLSKTYTAQVSGLYANIVSIETDLSNGLHAFSIVGLGDRAVGEAKDRISAAIKNSGFTSPKHRNQKIVISLAPANIKKEGTAFDLGMAMGYLAAAKNIVFETENKIFIGELSLEGNIHKTQGVLAMIIAAKKSGFSSAFVPRENAKEACLVSGINIYPVDSLLQVIEHFSKKKIIPIQPPTDTSVTTLNDKHSEKTKNNFGAIFGLEYAKRGLEIAAAGRHNVAMYGPPGTGKTMLAKAFAGILPRLTPEEILEVTSIHSIYRPSTDSNNIENSSIITEAPFRAPHHTSSYSAIIGGGSGNPRPGEITLAHRGIIFFDEFTEFDRRTIDSLRQPMEEKKITITRTRDSVTYPADCIYVLAMNPCICGGKKCICTEKEIARYKKKISGPIQDRIDIWLSVSKIEYSDFINDEKTINNTEKISQRIKIGRQFKEKRLSKENTQDIEPDALLFFTKSARKLGLSGRAYVRAISVARTIADLALSKEIKKEHIMEALQYRNKD